MQTFFLLLERLSIFRVVAALYWMQEKAIARLVEVAQFVVHMGDRSYGSGQITAIAGSW